MPTDEPHRRIARSGCATILAGREVEEPASVRRGFVMGAPPASARRRIGPTTDGIIASASSVDAKPETQLRRIYIYYIVRVKRRSVSVAIAFEKT
jgi:hypothetical protein